MDVRRCDRFLAERAADVPVVMVTVTNNSGGGQPVIAGEPAQRSARSVIVTACRSSSTPAVSPRTPGSSSEREDGQSERDIADIVREMASLADGMTMSAKKDAMGNIGGWLAMNDDALAEQCRTCSS